MSFVKFLEYEVKVNDDTRLDVMQKFTYPALG